MVFNVHHFWYWFRWFIYVMEVLRVLVTDGNEMHHNEMNVPWFAVRFL